MKKSIIFLLTISLFFISHILAEDIRVIGWNVESDGAVPQVVARRIAAFQGIHLWGLSEVEGSAVVEVFRKAAQDGENTSFDAILGTTGSRDRLLILYDKQRFEKINHFELHNINPGNKVRSPLVARLRDRKTSVTFYFMVNHLYRGDNEARHEQARLLNEWGSKQEFPVIAVGDYNFDWDVKNGDTDHDLGYDKMTAYHVFSWVRPPKLVKTQDTNFNSVLDFIFISDSRNTWASRSEIIVVPGDFPDDEETPDHRPVLGVFSLPFSDASYFTTINDNIESFSRFNGK